MRWHLRLLLPVVLLAVLIIPSVALADSSSYSGVGASAWGELFDEDPATQDVYASIFGGTQKSQFQTPGIKPEKAVWQSVDGWIDWPAATEDGISTSLYFTVNSYNMGIDRNLTMAGVHAVVPGTLTQYTWEPCPDEPDCWQSVTVSEEEVTVEVDFDWAGTGPLTKYRSSFSESSPYFRFFDRSSGMRRDAMVTGSIVVDGVNLVDGIEFHGDISKARSRTVTFGEPWYW